ncbi:MAG: TatD family hydrolase [Candidatus Calescibacterium sp.]|nr:TatD family hydrolase [Candidatus Calescibacterium sp.]MDW8132856.1 TatD family hydrolase [Candidatus Calescibacterium sp.]
MSLYFDFHCHLADEQYTTEDLSQILSICQQENITICSMSTNFEDFKLNLEYSNHPNVLIGFGIHPYEAHKIKQMPNWEEKIQKTIEQYKNLIKFIGEVGLDFYKMKHTYQQQIEVFEYFTYLSSEYNLPLSIHTRSAEKEVCNILIKYQKKKKLKAIFHCYTSTEKDIAKTILENEWYFGFGGVITFKKSTELREILKYIYDNKGNILCETDSPYITPEPYRGKKNYPYFVKIIYENVEKILKTKDFIFSYPI